MDLFSVDAAERHEEQKASRHASILFSKRATERFLGFLRASAHRDEFEARLALIDGDLNRLAAEITAETGHDAAYFVEHYRNHVAGGAFCDDCRKWKSGPKAGLCECSGESDNGEGALPDDVSAVGGKTAAPIEPGQAPGQPSTMSCDHCGQIVQALGTHEPCPHCGNMSGDQTLGDFSRQLGEAFLNPGGGGGHFGSTSVPFRVLATGEDSLGGKGEPSPKIDKSNAGDEKGHKHREPIKTDGGPYKTVHQDVSDTADHDKPFLEQTDAVAKHDQDVSKGHDTEAIHTDTWSGTEGLAKPVTSSSDEGKCGECGAVTFDGVCSNGDCSKSFTGDAENPKTDRSKDSHFLSDAAITNAVQSYSLGR